MALEDRDYMRAPYWRPGDSGRAHELPQRVPRRHAHRRPGLALRLTLLVLVGTPAAIALAVCGAWAAAWATAQI